MLTGHKPHTGDSPIQVAWAHVNKDVPAPSQYLANGTRAERDIAWLIPGYLDGLVRACTSRDPAKRPSDGRALLDLMRRVRHTLSTGRSDDPALAALQARASRPSVVITDPVAHALRGSTDRSTRRRGEPIHPGTASVPPWSRSNATPVSPRTPVSTPDSPSSPMDRRPAPQPSRPHSSTVVDRVLHIDQPTSQPRTPDWRRTPSIAVVAGSSPPSSSSWWRCCAHIWSSTSRPPSTPRAGFQEQIRSLEQPFTTNHPECTPSHKIFDVILGCRAKIIPRII